MPGQWAKLQESLLKSQLKVVREFLRQGQEPTFKPRGERRSQMSIVYDILFNAQAPLHVNDIISRAKTDFGLELDRESVVSAITKKVRSRRMFERVAPNTFSILQARQNNDSS